SRVVPAIVDHSVGFASPGDLTPNGTTRFPGTVLELTSGQNGQAGSAFTSGKVDLASFYTTFNFQFRAGSNPIADGIAFVIQGSGANALGGGGGGLGYSGITSSVAITYRAYDHSATELMVNGTTLVNNDLTPTGINFNNAAQSLPPD